MCSHGQVVEKYDFCVRHKCWCKSGNTDPKMHILINSLCSGCVYFLWSLVLMSQSVGTGKVHSLGSRTVTCSWLSQLPWLTGSLE